MIPFLFAMVAQGRIPLALSYFLDAGGFPFDVLDVLSQFFYNVDEVLVGGGELGVICHQLLEDQLFVDRGGGKVVEVSI